MSTPQGQWNHVKRGAFTQYPEDGVEVLAAVLYAHDNTGVIRACWLEQDSFYAPCDGDFRAGWFELVDIEEPLQRIAHPIGKTEVYAWMLLPAAPAVTFTGLSSSPPSSSGAE